MAIDQLKGEKETSATPARAKLCFENAETNWLPLRSLPSMAAEGSSVVCGPFSVGVR
jgi:hypothetical protein